MSEKTEITTEEFEAQRAALEAKLAECGERVRTLKAEGDTDAEVLTAAVTALRQAKDELKQAIKAYTKQFASEKLEVNSEALEDLLRRRLFFANSFEIYGGVKGLYDMGPPGAGVQSELLRLWRDEFVVRERLLELDATVLTPKPVLDASGHTEKFCDYMLESADGADYVRADHKLEEWLDVVLNDTSAPPERIEQARTDMGNVEAMSKDELEAALRRWFVPPAPEATKGGKKGKKAAKPAKEKTYDECWSAPREFNLMFATGIGPSGKQIGYLRPETAQGMFVNFRRLLDFNGSKLPFGAAQIGKAFRNEISPAQGLLRVREFWLAEIEYFVHPQRKTHPFFDRVADVTMRFFSSKRQLSDRKIETMTAKEALDAQIVSSEALVYFLARTWQFMTRIGLDMSAVRMRQHLPNEMAHYACDCWDAEVLTSNGWIEVVGHADRSAYDLDAHEKGSGVKLDVYEAWKEADWQSFDAVEAKLNKGALGKTLKGRAQPTMVALEALAANDADAAMALEAKLAADGTAQFDAPDGGDAIELTRAQVAFKRVKRVVKGETIKPSVIEPAFGLGRLMYCVFEHTFRQRPVEKETEKRNFLALPAVLAPIKCSVLPLVVNDDAQMRAARRVELLLLDAGVSVKVDDVNEAVGRRYARTDEIGIPFGVTVDTLTVDEQHAQHDTVTLRERDSCAQVRVLISQLTTVVLALLHRNATWSGVVNDQFQLPEFKA